MALPPAVAKMSNGDSRPVQPVAIVFGASGGGGGGGDASLEEQEAQTDLLTQIKGFVDGLETLVTTLNGYVDGLETVGSNTNTLLTTQAGYLDGVETLIGTTNTTLTALQGLVDGLETLGGNTNTLLSTQAGYLDGLEALIATLNGLVGSTNTLLTTQAGYVDGLETLIGTTNTSLTALAGFVDGLEALAAAATPAGENFIGKVGGSSAIVGGTFNRPGDTTPYAIGDLVANNTAAGSVTPVAVAAARVNAGTGSLRRVRLTTTKTGLAGTEIFRIHFFKTSPTVANGDNGAFSANGVSSVWLGAVDCTMSQAFSDGTKGNGVPNSGSEITFEAAAATTNIFALIEARTAYTPANAETFTIACEIFRD